GEPVRRVPQKPAIAGEMSDLKAPGKLSNDRLDKLGFTKFERQSDGSYERTAGKMGPRHLTKED
ncbi:MAG: FmdB family transcriptional regulator, partial [Planctomycetota bacterium]